MENQLYHSNSIAIGSQCASKEKIDFLPLNGNNDQSYNNDDDDDDDDDSQESVDFSQALMNATWHVTSCKKSSMRLRKRKSMRERVIKIEQRDLNFLFIICRKCRDPESEDDSVSSSISTSAGTNGRSTSSVPSRSSLASLKRGHSITFDGRSTNSGASRSSLLSMKRYSNTSLISSVGVGDGTYDEFNWAPKYEVDVRDIVILSKSDACCRIQMPLQSNKPVSRLIHFQNKYAGKRFDFSRQWISDVTDGNI